MLPKKKPLSKTKDRNGRTLGTRIQAILDHGLSPEETAHRLGISMATFYRWRQKEPVRPLRALVANLERLEKELQLAS